MVLIASSQYRSTCSSGLPISYKLAAGSRGLLRPRLHISVGTGCSAVFAQREAGYDWFSLFLTITAAAAQCFHPLIRRLAKWSYNLDVTDQQKGPSNDHRFFPEDMNLLFLK